MDLIRITKDIVFFGKDVVGIDSKKEQAHIIYSLDIGTRCVKGLIAEKQNASLKIRSMVVMEHEERAMLDGAIHDVQKVSRIVEEVTKKLQAEIGHGLKHVSVAMAGRFLRTSIGESRLDVSQDHAISSDSVRMIEMNAISASIQELDVKSHEMYCVGYSVLYYSLDGEWIRNLEGQRGKEAYVKVIAAFLPAYVVNAMMNVLEQTSLVPEHITLEPIAAMNLVVPTDLRKLNIALVDVGAGTSDIAISRDGTIIAYGMVPMAGDEITERLCEQYLLDFTTAEKVKRTLSDENPPKEIIVKDILDTSVTITREEWIEMITPVVDEIIEQITSEILNLNGKPPAAVLIIGGGAKVSGFAEALAKKLKLPQSRVALKMVENLSMIDDPDHLLHGSEYITPVGIANSVGTHTGSVFVRVSVNGTPTDLMAIDGKNTVMQALLQLGYRVEAIIGKPGPAIALEVNGELTFIKGTMGKEAKITVNGKPASTRTRLSHGDMIHFESGQEGHSPWVFLSSIIKKVSILLNGSVVEVWPSVSLNGEEISDDVELQDKDIVDFSPRITLQNMLDHLHIQQKEYISLLLNGLPKSVLWKKLDFYQVGSSQVSTLLEPDSIIAEGAGLISKTMEKAPVVRTLLQDIEVSYCRCTVNGSQKEIPITIFQISIDGTQANMDSILYDGCNVQIESIDNVPKIVDVFPLIHLDVSNLRSYSLKLNGNNAAFLDPLEEGDTIEINLHR